MLVTWIESFSKNRFHKESGQRNVTSQGQRGDYRIYT